MKLKKFAVLFVILCCFQSTVWAAQEAIGVDYFEVKGAKTFTCWTNKSSIYIGRPATLIITARWI